jgi:hypothetical protein
MEEEFNAWYDGEHVPERLAAPGFESARRYYATQAQRRYLALYDMRSIDALSTPEYLACSGANNSPWTIRMISRCNFVRIPAVQVYPGDGPTSSAPRLLMMRFAGAQEKLNGIVETARQVFSTQRVRQVRVFAAQENADVYVIAEGYPGIEDLPGHGTGFEAADHIDLIHLYAAN